MNSRENDIMNILLTEPYRNQRVLADISGYSLGCVNSALKFLVSEGYLSAEFIPTKKAHRELNGRKPKNAIILAAGAGMRMVPINMETPKALLTVNNETLIERIIKQLHEAGIYEIYVVAGFMKEQLEYLIDEYGVKLVVNPQYASKNNLYSMSLVLEHLSNSYVIPCDIWFDSNPFSRNESYSWYMVSEKPDKASPVRVNRKMELVAAGGKNGGNAMIGITYLIEEQAAIVREKIKELVQDERYDGSFWEEALFDKDRMIVPAKVVSESQAVEINTYEQLRNLNGNVEKQKKEIAAEIADVVGIDKNEVTGIEAVKNGLTNNSFLVTCGGRKYIMRIPVKDEDRLINRVQEAEVYGAIKGRNLSDEVVYINPENGHKISAYYDNAYACDSNNATNVDKCMKFLRKFHDMDIRVSHEFDIFEKIELYESLWSEKTSIYRDYETTKQNVLSLRPYIERHVEKKVLTHMDAVPDNFLFVSQNGKEELRLIDWECAGMQDPHVDIALFGIYSFYDRKRMDELIDAYFPDGCSDEIRIKIYCYVSVCGLMWSNWCEYKRNMGVEFGGYSISQYRYAKEYYRLVKDMCSEI